MVLFSKYSNGKFHDGKWFCGCNEEAKWHTSSTENSLGERFACCQGWRSGQRDCRFFLAEADEPQARLDKTVDELPSTPQTPVSRRTTQTMLTPGTGSRSRANLFGSGRRRRVASLNESPTARRFVHVDAGDGDLANVVVDLLREEGIALKSSTESRLRYTIGSRVAKHEAALETSHGSLEFALEKLRELER